MPSYPGSTSNPNLGRGPRPSKAERRRARRRSIAQSRATHSDGISDPGRDSAVSVKVGAGKSGRVVVGRPSRRRVRRSTSRFLKDISRTEGLGSLNKRDSDFERLKSKRLARRTVRPSTSEKLEQATAHLDDPSTLEVLATGDISLLDVLPVGVGAAIGKQLIKRGGKEVVERVAREGAEEAVERGAKGAGQAVRRSAPRPKPKPRSQTLRGKREARQLRRKRVAGKSRQPVRGKAKEVRARTRKKVDASPAPVRVPAKIAGKTTGATARHLGRHKIAYGAPAVGTGIYGTAETGDPTELVERPAKAVTGIAKGLVEDPEGTLKATARAIPGIVTATGALIANPSLTAYRATRRGLEEAGLPGGKDYSGEEILDPVERLKDEQIKSFKDFAGTYASGDVDRIAEATKKDYGLTPLAVALPPATRALRPVYRRGRDAARAKTAARREQGKRKILNPRKKHEPVEYDPERPVFDLAHRRQQRKGESRRSAQTRAVMGHEQAGRAKRPSKHARKATRQLPEEHYSQTLPNGEKVKVRVRAGDVVGYAYGKGIPRDRQAAKKLLRQHINRLEREGADNLPASEISGLIAARYLLKHFDEIEGNDAFWKAVAAAHEDIGSQAYSKAAPYHEVAVEEGVQFPAERLPEDVRPLTKATDREGLKVEIESEVKSLRRSNAGDRENLRLADEQVRIAESGVRAAKDKLATAKRHYKDEERSPAPAQSKAEPHAAGGKKLTVKERSANGAYTVEKRGKKFVYTDPDGKVIRRSDGNGDYKFVVMAPDGRPISFHRSRELAAKANRRYITSNKNKIEPIVDAASVQRKADAEPTSAPAAAPAKKAVPAAPAKKTGPGERTNQRYAQALVELEEAQARLKKAKADRAEVQKLAADSAKVSERKLRQKRDALYDKLTREERRDVRRDLEDQLGRELNAKAPEDRALLSNAYREASLRKKVETSEKLTQEFIDDVQRVIDKKGYAQPGWRSHESLLPAHLQPGASATGAQISPLGRISGDKPREGTLARLGAVDESFDSLMRGSVVKPVAKKRILGMWRDFINERSKAFDGKSEFTSDEVGQLIADRRLNTKDYALVPRQLYKRAFDALRRSEDMTDADFEQTIVSPLRDVVSDQGPPKQGRLYRIVPREALNELMSQSEGVGGALKAANRVNRLQGRVLLGTNPSWLAMQFIAEGMQAAVATGHVSDLLLPFGRGRTAKGLRAVAKLSPEEQWGFAAMAGETPGVRLDIGDMRTRLESGDVDNAANALSAMNRTPAFRALKKAGKLETLGDIDRWKGGLIRRGVAAAHIDREINGFFAGIKNLARAEDNIFKQLRGKSLEEQLAYFAKNPRAAREVSSYLEDVMGNWNALTRYERLPAAVTAFYPFLRMSLRYTFKSLPHRHPLKASMLYYMGAAGSKHLAELLQNDPAFFQQWAQVPLYTGGSEDKEDFATIDLSRAAPGGNALVEAIGDSDDPLFASTRILQPAAGAVLTLFTGKQTFGSDVGPGVLERGAAAAAQLLAFPAPARLLDQANASTRVGGGVLGDITEELGNVLNKNETKLTQRVTQKGVGSFVMPALPQRASEARLRAQLAALFDKIKLDPEDQDAIEAVASGDVGRQKRLGRQRKDADKARDIIDLLEKRLDASEDDEIDWNAVQKILGEGTYPVAQPKKKKTKLNRSGSSAARSDLNRQILGG